MKKKSLLVVLLCVVIVGVALVFVLQAIPKAAENQVDLSSIESSEATISGDETLYVNNREDGTEEIICIKDYITNEISMLKRYVDGILIEKSVTSILGGYIEILLPEGDELHGIRTEFSEDIGVDITYNYQWESEWAEYYQTHSPMNGFKELGADEYLNEALGSKINEKERNRIIDTYTKIEEDKQNGKVTN